MSETTTDRLTGEPAGDAEPAEVAEAVPSNWQQGALPLLLVAIVAGLLGWLIGRGGLSAEPDTILIEPDPAEALEIPLPLDELESLPDLFDQLREGAPPEFEEFLESLPEDFGGLFDGDPSRLFEEFFDQRRFERFFDEGFTGDEGFTVPRPGEGFRRQFDELRESLGLDLPAIGFRPPVPEGYRLGGRNLTVETVDGRVEFAWSMVAVGPEGEAVIELTGDELDTTGEEIDLGGVTGYLSDEGIRWPVGDGQVTASVSSDALSEEALIELATAVAQSYR